MPVHRVEPVLAPDRPKYPEPRGQPGRDAAPRAAVVEARVQDEHHLAGAVVRGPNLGAVAGPHRQLRHDRPPPHARRADRTGDSYANTSYVVHGPVIANVVPGSYTLTKSVEPSGENVTPANSPKDSSPSSTITWRFRAIA